MMTIQSGRFGAVGAAAVGYLTAESLGTVTEINGATFSDMATLSPTLGQMAPGADYLLFWGLDGSVSNNLGSATGRLLKDGAALVTANCFPKESSSPIDKNSMGGFVIEAGGAAPVYKVQIGNNAQAANAVGTNARISLLILGANDHHATSAGRITTTSTSQQTAATLTFTPATTGPHTILVCALVDGTVGVTNPIGVQITDGTTSTVELGVQPNNTASRVPILLQLHLSLTSGVPVTITLLYRNMGAGGGTVGISEMRLASIDDSRFANVHKTNLGSDQTIATTTYAASLSQTFTPSADDHLTIMSGMGQNSSSSNSSFWEYDDDGTVVSENIREVAAGFPTDAGAQPFLSHRIAAYAASSRTQAIKHKSLSSNTTTTKRGAAIVTFDLTGI
jgi:hypothetical protein